MPFLAKPLSAFVMSLMAVWKFYRLNTLSIKLFRCYFVKAFVSSFSNVQIHLAFRKLIMFVTPKKSSYACPRNAPKKKVMPRWQTWVLDAVPPFPNLESRRARRSKWKPPNLTVQRGKWPSHSQALTFSQHLHSFIHRWEGTKGFGIGAGSEWNGTLSPDLAVLFEKERKAHYTATRWHYFTQHCSHLVCRPFPKHEKTRWKLDWGDVLTNHTSFVASWWNATHGVG